MIKPLTIGNKTFAINLIQGPLAGVSCAPFRRLASHYTQPAFSCTEMISCKTLIHQAKTDHRRFVTKDPNEGSVCFQLSANNPDELARGTEIAVHYGADLIDLNCGCPVKKIRSKGAGSSLLADPDKLYLMIQAMKQHSPVPIGIKIRVDARSGDQFNASIAEVVKTANADFLVVHGRHWTHRYDIPCEYADIQFFVEALDIPVIGNGDVSDINSLKNMIVTGCAGVMISRAAMGQPWLIAQLIAQMAGESYDIPSAQEIGMIFLEHIEALSDLLGSEKFAIIQARTFAKYYARTMVHKTLFCDEINHCDNLKDLKKIYEKFLAE